jgi:hypothetical protein
MEVEQKLIIRFLHREYADPRDIQARLSAQFGDAAYSLRSVQRWCQYVRQGCEVLDDESRSGRPPSDCLHIQILSFLEKQPFDSAFSLPEIPNVSRATLLHNLWDPVGMKMFNLPGIPHMLTEQLPTTRIRKCQELLPLLERMEGNKFRNIITGNGSRFTREYQHAARWSPSYEEMPERARRQIGTKKCILTVIWGVDGLRIVDLMASERSFNSKYFASDVLAPMIEKVFPQGRNPQTRRVHFSKATEHFVTKNHILHVPHAS